MGYGNKIFSPVSRNDVTRSPGEIGRPLDSVQFQPREELVIMEAVSEKPTVTSNEILEEIYGSTGPELALSSIHYYLKCNVITRKKVINVPELDCLIN